MKNKTHELVHTMAATIGLVCSIALVPLGLTSCTVLKSQKGGSATALIQRHGHTNAVTLAQSENPKDPSSQSLQSEQVFECVLPAGTMIPLPADGAEPMTGWGTEISNVERVRTNITGLHNVVVLTAPMPVKVIARDRSETRIGAAHKDRVKEWMAQAANVKPVMWAGIAMMTVVAGAFIYFRWWTKAAAAIGIGVTMIVVAQSVPDHGPMILFVGLALFALIALLVLYSYHKGQLDLNLNGIPDFLERNRADSAELGVKGSSNVVTTGATPLPSPAH